MKDTALEERREKAQRFLDILETRGIFSRDFEYRGCSITVCADDTHPEVLAKIEQVDKRYRDKIKRHVNSLKRLRGENV